MMTEEGEPMICSKNGDRWYCTNMENGESHSFIDYSDYDVATDILLAQVDMGYRDLRELVDLLKEWDNDYQAYDNILYEYSVCVKQNPDNAFYCLLSSIESEAKSSLPDEIDNYLTIPEDYEEEFKEWLNEELSEVELDYNYIAWGCAYEPEEGICDVLIDYMENGGKLSETGISELKNIYNEWKKEYEDIEEDEDID